MAPSDLSLPDAQLLTILQYLGTEDLGRIGRVNRQWYRVSHDTQLWRRVIIPKVDNKYIRAVLKNFCGEHTTKIVLIGALKHSKLSVISDSLLHKILSICRLADLIVARIHLTPAQIRVLPTNLRKLSLLQMDSRTDISHLNQLEFLDLRGSRKVLISPASLTKLTHLSFAEGTTKLDDFMLNSNLFSRITHLDLSFNHLTLRQMSILSTDCRSLQALDIDYTRFPYTNQQLELNFKNWFQMGFSSLEQIKCCYVRCSGNLSQVSPFVRFSADFELPPSVTVIHCKDYWPNVPYHIDSTRPCRDVAQCSLVSLLYPLVIRTPLSLEEHTMD